MSRSMTFPGEAQNLLPCPCCGHDGDDVEVIRYSPDVEPRHDTVRCSWCGIQGERESWDCRVVPSLPPPPEPQPANEVTEDEWAAAGKIMSLGAEGCRCELLDPSLDPALCGPCVKALLLLRGLAALPPEAPREPTKENGNGNG